MEYIRIKDLFDKFLENVGIPKNRFYFLFNREKLDYDDSRKIILIVLNNSCIYIVMHELMLLKY